MVKLSRTSLSLRSDVLRALISFVEDFVDDFGVTSACFVTTGFTVAASIFFFAGTMGLAFFGVGFLATAVTGFAAGNGMVFVATVLRFFATVVACTAGVGFDTGLAGNFTAALRAGATAFFVGAALPRGAVGAACLVAGFFGVATGLVTVEAATEVAATDVADAFKVLTGAAAGRAPEAATLAVASGDGDAGAMEFVMDLI